MEKSIKESRITVKGLAQGLDRGVRNARTTDKGGYVPNDWDMPKIQSSPLICVYIKRGVNEGVDRRFKSGHWLQF